MASKAASPFKRTLFTLVKIGIYATFLGIIAIAVAVGVAMSRLPSYGDWSGATISAR
jgi:hypothetical protein